ncbi:hypothetical protein EMCRGX_G012850 [Ephydatia muelleri]
MSPWWMGRGMMVEVMLDSGSSVSLVRHDIAKRFNGRTSAGDMPKLRLVSAGEEELPIMNNVKAAVKLSGIEEVPEHSFIVVDQLISQVILGVDFLQQQEKADTCEHSTWTSTTTRTRSNAGNTERGERAEREGVHRGIPGDPASDEADECVISIFNEFADAEFPGFVKPCFEETVRQARDRFVKTPWLTKLACHQIDTVGSPTRVPPRRIPAHFQQEVQEQMNDMLKKGIIVESSSSWLAPAVYTREKTGEIRLCVDYREANKRTRKDAYPLPLIDEVQDRLLGATVFSKLDLQCGYWQVPVDPKDQEKTAFSPGPGMGLFQFTRMPFGLCGAPSTFQRLMDVVMRGLPFVTTYIDDVLIHSANEELHKSHLEQAFQRLREAGLTLRGSKCQIGMAQVTYLGHNFSRAGMSPDTCSSKVEVLHYTSWALAIQEFSFEIVYRMGTTNGNADALSQRRGPDRETLHAALTTVHAGFTAEEIRQAQQQDKTTLQLYNALHSEQRPPHRDWKKPPLRRYAQLWSQLDMVDGIVCRKYHSGPTSDTLVVPVLPEALHQQALSMCHDSQAAGHQGTHKTLERIGREAYWVNMAQDVERHCRVCVTCQKSKLPMPVRSPLTNIPIGRPWQMIAIDILEVPVSTKNSRYLLVIQDYCTNWADARPLPDQTAIRITAKLVKLFCTYGIPEIVHSDQGRNFESSIGDGMVERFNRSLLQLLRTYPNTLTPSREYEATSYQAVLQAKMAELQDLVAAHIVESAHWQKVDDDRHSAERPFKPGDLVWLSVPTASKLDPPMGGELDSKAGEITSHCGDF